MVRRTSSTYSHTDLIFPRLLQLLIWILHYWLSEHLYMCIPTTTQTLTHFPTVRTLISNTVLTCHTFSHNPKCEIFDMHLANYFLCTWLTTFSHVTSMSHFPTVKKVRMRTMLTCNIFSHGLSNVHWTITFEMWFWKWTKPFVRIMISLLVSVQSEGCFWHVTSIVTFFSRCQKVRILTWPINTKCRGRKSDPNWKNQTIVNIVFVEIFAFFSQRRSDEKWQTQNHDMLY
jgi:hypothetical protein